MDSITERAHAKINITLDIVGESKGFHLLDMLVATVDIADEVEVSLRKDKNIVCKMDGILQKDNNSAYKAALLLMERFKTNGFNIEIKKNIPMAGGLGGSTADGVAVIKAARKLLDINKKLIDDVWLLSLGSDAPCMMTDGFKRVRGIGEKVDFIDLIIPYKVGFIAGSGVNTKKAYALFDKMKLRGSSKTEALFKAIDACDFDVAAFLNNDLLLPACKLNPDITPAIETIKSSNPAAWNMSGSGSTVYGLFEDKVPQFLTETDFVK